MKCRAEHLKRKAEAIHYIDLVDALTQPGAQISHGTNNLTTPTTWMTTAKAAGFLVIYNMVESSIKSAFLEAYEAIGSEKLTWDALRDELRELWIESQHARLSRETASPSNYLKKARELVHRVVARELIKLTGDDLPISGNLDARAIRELCATHGINHQDPAAAHGGADLLTVKNKRNNLAHGIESFNEVGRLYTANDLRRFAEQSADYVDAIMVDIDDYLSKRAFLKAAPLKATP